MENVVPIEVLPGLLASFATALSVLHRRTVLGKFGHIRLPLFRTKDNEPLSINIASPWGKGLTEVGRYGLVLLMSFHGLDIASWSIEQTQKILNSLSEKQAMGKSIGVTDIVEAIVVPTVGVYAAAYIGMTVWHVAFRSVKMFDGAMNPNKYNTRHWAEGMLVASGLAPRPEHIIVDGPLVQTAADKVFNVQYALALQQHTGSYRNELEVTWASLANYLIACRGDISEDEYFASARYREDLNEFLGGIRVANIRNSLIESLISKGALPSNESYPFNV